MSFWSDIGSEIALEVKALGAEVAKFAAYLKPLVVADAKSIGIAALQAVITQAPLVIAGTEKMAAAVASVKTTLASSGKTAALDVISAAIQDAHDQLAAAANPTVVQ